MEIPHEVIGTVIMLVIAVLIAAFLGKLLSIMAIGGPSKNLNAEFERISKRRAEHAAETEMYQLLVDGREEDLGMRKGKDDGNL